MVHVRDVMTTDVVTVGLEATYGEMVDRLLAHDISGLPVVDADGILLGLVTEADLVSREAYGSDRRRPLGLVADYLRDRDPGWLRTASGTTAREIMTHDVTTASPDDELRVAARRMLESGCSACRWSPRMAGSSASCRAATCSLWRTSTGRRRAPDPLA